MREIPLTQGKVALVDDEDYEEVSKYRWHAVQKRGGRTWYAMTNVRKGDGTRTTVEMHAVILGKDPAGRQIDHRNCNGLDNQRGNLRYATMSEQRRNSVARIGNKSGFKGVWLHKPTGQYRAEVRTSERRIYAGYHATPEEAAKAYDKAARAAFGDYARTNFEAE